MSAPQKNDPNDHEGYRCPHCDEEIVKHGDHEPCTTRQIQAMISEGGPVCGSGSGLVNK
jgi:hypothetical protein